jgi:hypothetical protein
MWISYPHSGWITSRSCPQPSNSVGNLSTVDVDKCFMLEPPVRRKKSIHKVFINVDKSSLRAVEKQNAQEIHYALLHIYEWLSTILTDLSTFSHACSNFIIMRHIMHVAHVPNYIACHVEDVENLSTVAVDK